MLERKLLDFFSGSGVWLVHIEQFGGFFWRVQFQSVDRGFGWILNVLINGPIAKVQKHIRNYDVKKNSETSIDMKSICY